MTEYRNLPENYPLFINIRNKRLPLSAFIFLSLVTYSYYTDGVKGTISFVVIFILLFTVGYLIGKKRQKQAFYSYRLIIEGDTLTRHQNNVPVMQIPFNKITTVEELNSGFLLIKGREKEDKIVVWPYIENFSQVRSLLESYSPVTPVVYKNVFQKYPALFGLLILASMTLVYLSSNKIIVAISGVTVLSCAGWTFYKLRTSKQVATTTKKWAWVILIFLLSIISAMYQKLIV